MSAATSSPTTVARSSVGTLLRDAARLDRTQSDPLVALRNAIGIAAPLAVGALAGNAAIGLATTVGAIQAAFADRPGPYRLRMVRMLGVSVVTATTSALAVAASRTDAASTALLLVFAFGAALLVTAGPSATQVGTAAVAAALVLGHVPSSPSVAVHVGLLVLAGGAIQTVLALAGWPLRRHRPERLALARLYRELAAAARLPRGTGADPPAGDTLTAVRQTFYGLGHDHGPSVEAYRVLLDEAERIRRDIVVVAAIAERLGGDGNPILAGLVRSALGAAGDVLAELADSLARARPIDERVLDQVHEQIHHTIRRLADSADAPAELTRRAVAARLRALAGQLRAAVESTRTGASEGGGGEPRGPRGVALLRDPIAILRANLTPDSAIVRHAVRVAVLVAGSDLVVRLAGLNRGYWVSLTVLVVLRPDFGATLQRSVLRTVGTIIGLLAATALVHYVPGGQWWEVALVLVFAFGMRLAGPGNFGLTAVSLSGLVVIMLEIQGTSAHTTLLDRALATVIGGVLALVATLALPSWEREFVPRRLGALLAAYQTYLAAVADPAVDPAVDSDGLNRARAASRRARTDAQASVDRARAEPVRGHDQVELGQMVLAHTHRFIHAVLAVDAVRDAVRAGPPEVAAFLTAAGAALGSAADAIAGEMPPRSVLQLRPLHEELTERLDADPELVGGPATAAVIVEATDRITNSLDTLHSELRRQLGETPALASSG
jgi:uncharacterized membrane protein YccC